MTEPHGEEEGLSAHKHRGQGTKTASGTQEYKCRSRKSDN